MVCIAVCCCQYSAIRLYKSEPSKIHCRLISNLFISKDCDKYIQLIAALSYGSTLDLGFDPTVMALKGTDNKISFDFAVEGTDSTGNPIKKMYRTVKGISEFSADAIRGRATRVYEVKEVVGGIPRGESFALKDCWVDDDRAVEGDILLKILSDCTDEERGFFLTLVAHGIVKVDDAGTRDNTKTVMMRGFDVYQNESKYHFKLPDEPEEAIISPERVSSGLPQSSAFVSMARVQQEDKEYPWKDHYRIVFKEVGTSMYEIRSLRDAFQALIDMTKGV